MAYAMKTQLFITLIVALSCTTDQLQVGPRPERVRRQDSETIQGSREQGVVGDLISGSIRKDYILIYEFSYELNLNKTSALRINFEAPDASFSKPVFVSVRQRREQTSWEVPLITGDLESPTIKQQLENSSLAMRFRNVSRTLCPPELDNSSGQENIQVEVTYMFDSEINFSLMVYEFEDFVLETGVTTTFTTSPAQPVYFQYTIPDGVWSIIVRAESDDDICVIMSIQPTKCPVHDLNGDVEFQGTFQSMTRKGAMTVTVGALEKAGFQDKSFFVVFVVRTTDEECSGAKVTSPFVNDTGRDKVVRVTAVHLITKGEYVAAIIGVFVFFLFLYLVEGLIYYLRHHVLKNKEPEDQPEIEVNENKVAAEVLHNESDARLLTNGAEQNPDKYGATGDALPLTEENVSKLHGESQEGAYDQQDGVSIVNSESFDKLSDIETEKNVYRNKVNIHVLDLARKGVRYHYRKFKLYYVNICTLAIFYALPVIQLVITYQRMLNLSGNEDICYYNFQCIHQAGILSAFNNIYSNIGYIMLGILFLIIIKRREILALRKLDNEEELLEKGCVCKNECGIQQHYGSFQAMGVGLVMEGIMSGCYHVCPSYMNFQFDTSFMYMIGWICMLTIYQKRHPDISPRANIAYFCIAVVILVALIGVLYGTVYFWIFFTIFHLTITTMVSFKIYFMGGWQFGSGFFIRLKLLWKSHQRCQMPINKARFFLILGANIINWMIAFFGLFTRPSDFNTYLLGIFILNLTLYFSFYITMKLICKEKILFLTWIYIAIAGGLWLVSFYFFSITSSNWQFTPAVSRSFNEPCSLLNFYDTHDIWHFLSSMALFMSFVIILTLDDALDNVPRSEIIVF